MPFKKLNLFKRSKDHNSPTDNVFQLVAGTFSPIEAADVLLSLINYKIKYHSVQILNLQDRDELFIKNSETRIEALKETKQKMTKLIIDARKEGASLEINSIVSVILKK